MIALGFFICMGKIRCVWCRIWLDGMRVTELAEYCFSFKSMPEKLKTELGIEDILRPDMTELCDDYIERVILPDGEKDWQAVLL